MFIAMNNFKIAPGRGPDFEQQWRSRESYLKDAPGFVEFALLRGDTEGEYASHTVWKDRAAFAAWAESPAFRAAHAQGSLQGILAGPPHVTLYEAVMIERPDAATAGN